MSISTVPLPRSASSTTAVTVLLTNEQAARLDEIRVGIRRTTGESISRSALIRAIINGLLPYQRNLLNCTSEADISHKISRVLEIATRHANTAR